MLASDVGQRQHPRLRQVLEVVRRVGRQHPRRGGVLHHVRQPRRRVRHPRQVAQHHLVVDAHRLLRVLVLVRPSLPAHPVHGVEDVLVKLHRTDEVRVGTPLRDEVAHHVHVATGHAEAAEFRLARRGGLECADVQVGSQPVDPCQHFVVDACRASLRLDVVAQPLEGEHHLLAANQFVRHLVSLARQRGGVQPRLLQLACLGLRLGERLVPLNEVVVLLRLEVVDDLRRLVVGDGLLEFLGLGDHHVVAVPAARSPRHVLLDRHQAGNLGQCFLAVSLQRLHLVVGLARLGGGDQFVVRPGDGLLGSLLLHAQQLEVLLEHVTDNILRCLGQLLETLRDVRLRVEIVADPGLVEPRGLERPLSGGVHVLNEPVDRSGPEVLEADRQVLETLGDVVDLAVELLALHHLAHHQPHIVLAGRDEVARHVGEVLGERRPHKALLRRVTQRVGDGVDRAAQVLWEPVDVLIDARAARLDACGRPRGGEQVNTCIRPPSFRDGAEHGIGCIKPRCVQ